MVSYFEGSDKKMSQNSGSGLSYFLETSKILTGRLPPEDGSDWRETLGKRVSDDFAKMIFPAEIFFWGHFFEKIENFGRPFTPQGWLRLA